LLLEEVSQIKRYELAINGDSQLKQSQEVLLLAYLSELVKQKPLQYILGYAEFYGLKFYVDESVLIPRPETEELVRWIVEDYKMIPNLKVIDVGTGSGCVAVSLGKYLKNSKIAALDKSADALEIAKLNANENKVAINFILGDILVIDSEKFATFDIIVSNPPYVRNSERHQMKANVLDYEPHMALFVKDDNPLVFYDAIMNFAVDKLNSNGALYFEINEYLSQPLEKLVVEKGYFQHEFRNDMFGKPRMLKLIKF